MLVGTITTATNWGCNSFNLGIRSFHWNMRFLAGTWRQPIKNWPTKMMRRMMKMWTIMRSDNRRKLALTISLTSSSNLWMAQSSYKLTWIEMISNNSSKTWLNKKFNRNRSKLNHQPLFYWTHCKNPYVDVGILLLLMPDNSNQMMFSGALFVAIGKIKRLVISSSILSATIQARKPFAEWKSQFYWSMKTTSPTM